MNFRNLHTFVTVADAGGFARAEDRLNLTQSAASRQIMALEAELGVALFDRVGRSIHLTAEGKDLLQRSRQLLDDTASLGERAKALKGGHVGTLRVGAPTQVIENLLTPFIMGYRNRYPEVDINLLEAAADQLQGHLDRGDVQLGIMPSGHDPFDGRLLYPIYVSAVVSKTNRFARRRVVEISELADESLLLLGRQFGLRSWFEAACDVARVKPKALMESVAPHTMVALASVGFGIAIVPSDTQPRQDAVRLIRITHRGVAVGRWAVITWNPQRFLPPYAAKFVEELALSVRRAYPGSDLLKRAPRLPRPKLPMR